MAYSGRILKPITINNAYGATDANRPIVIPLSRHNVNLGDFAADGRDLDIVASDQETSIAHQLLTWNSTLGLHLDRVITARAGNGTYTWNQAVRILQSDLEDYSGGRNFLWAAGTNQLSTWRGELNVYDEDLDYVATIPTPSNDYVMGMHVADIDEDGEKEILFSGRYATTSAFGLRQNGTQMWSWNAGANTYLRMCGASQPVPGYGVLVAFGTGGATTGDVTVRYGVNGNQLWRNSYTSNNDGNRTIQGGYILDAQGAGPSSQKVIFCQGSILRGVNLITGVTQWTYTHPVMNLPIDGNFYEVAPGRLASTTSYSHVAAYTAMPGTDVSNIFWLVVVNDSGQLVWEKAYIGSCFNVHCADLDGDGYDEIVVGLEYGQAFDSHGGYMVLDRFGELLGMVWLPGASRSQAFATFTSGNRLLASSLMQLYSYRLTLGEGAGATVQAVLPSVTAGESQTVYLAKSNNPTLIPAYGAYHWDLSGANGSAVPGGTTQGPGTWTIESNAIQSNDSGNTAQAAYLDFADVSADGIEFEFTFQKPNMSDGTAADYYAGCWYGSTNYSSGRPYGFYLAIGAKGNLEIRVRQSGTGSILGTVFNTTSSGLTYTTSDVLRCRVTWSGNQHSVQIKKNSGEFVSYVRAEYSGTGNITGAGSVGFVNVRGRSKYSDIKLRTVPREYGGGGVGYGPYSSLDALSTRRPLWYPGLTRRRRR